MASPLSLLLSLLSISYATSNQLNQSPYQRIFVIEAHGGYYGETRESTVKWKYDSTVELFTPPGQCLFEGKAQEITATFEKQGIDVVNFYFRDTIHRINKGDEIARYFFRFGIEFAIISGVYEYHQDTNFLFGLQSGEPTKPKVVKKYEIKHDVNILLSDFAESINDPRIKTTILWNACALYSKKVPFVKWVDSYADVVETNIAQRNQHLLEKCKAEFDPLAAKYKALYAEAWEDVISLRHIDMLPKTHLAHIDLVKRNILMFMEKEKKRSTCFGKEPNVYDCVGRLMNVIRMEREYTVWDFAKKKVREYQRMEECVNLGMKKGLGPQIGFKFDDLSLSDRRSSFFDLYTCDRQKVKQLKKQQLNAAYQDIANDYQRLHRLVHMHHIYIKNDS